MEKKNKSIKNILLALGIFIVYTIFSFWMLGYDKEENRIYYDGLGLAAKVPSVIIDQAHPIKQYFYSTQYALGIEIQFGTYGKKVNDDLKIAFYDASDDSCLGVETIKSFDIRDNKWYRVDFSGYYLEEGKQYYYIVSRDNMSKDKVSLWLGEKNKIEKEDDYDHSPLLSDYYVGDKKVSGYAAVTNICYHPSGRFIIVWIYVSIFYVLGTCFVFFTKNKKKLLLKVTYIMMEYIDIILILVWYATNIRTKY